MHGKTITYGKKKKDNKSLAFYQSNKLYLAGNGTKIPRSTK